MSESKEPYLSSSKVSYENPTVDRNPSVQAILDTVGFQRTPFIVCIDPYCQGFANANTKEEADELWVTYTNAGHKSVVTYVRSDLYNAVHKTTPEKQEAKIPLPNDPVNHPAHYTFSRFEVIDVLSEWFPENPLLWQVCKYIARANYKNNYLQDLQKAKWYLERAIQEASK